LARLRILPGLATSLVQSIATLLPSFNEFPDLFQFCLNFLLTESETEAI
jgi:hypothetical protein